MPDPATPPTSAVPVGEGAGPPELADAEPLTDEELATVQRAIDAGWILGGAEVPDRIIVSMAAELARLRAEKGTRP